MQIHCPNCKNVSESIKNPPGYAAWIIAICYLLLGGFVTALALNNKEPLIAGLLFIVSAPLSFAAFGHILWWSKRVVSY
jgi:Zn-dependent protease with chaperone function